MSTAGYEAVRVEDLTEDFLGTATRLLQLELRFADDLRPVVGEEILRSRRNALEETIEGIRAGLLHRALFVARRPEAAAPSNR